MDNPTNSGHVVVVDTVPEIRRLIDSPSLERLEEQERLGSLSYYFDLSPLSASNGKHFPFVNKPDRKAIKKIEDEIRQYLSEITEDDYKKIATLVRQKASDDEILLAFSKITGNKFGRCKVDKSFLRNARSLPSISDIYDDPRVVECPVRIEKAREKVIQKTGDDYIRLHNCIVSMFLSIDMIKKTVLQKDKTIFQIISENASLKYAVRVVKTPIIINGKQCQKGTVVLFNIAKASRETGDTRFAFGQGTNDRRCPFGFFMEKFLEELRRY